MGKHLVKIDNIKRCKRIVIPRKIIDKLKWHDVAYVFVEGDPRGRIIIRRVLDAEALKTDD